MENTLQIQEKVKDFILKTSYVSIEEINNDTFIFEQGIMDSMGFMSLITFLEDSFSVVPKGEELLEVNFESIKAITGFIIKKLEKK